MDTAFRKIDIDQYDEDVLQDSELYEADSRDPSEVLDDAKQKQVAVRGFLARYIMFLLFYLVFSYQISFRSDISGALTTILENAPYGPSVDEAKVRTRRLP